MSADSPAALLINAAGTEIATNANPVRVDPTGTTAQPVTDNGGSLTVDGTVAVSGSVAVTGPLTDAQLRAAAVPVSAAALPLPAGAATEATLALIKAKTDNLDVALSTRAVTGLTDAQLRATAVPVSGPLTDAQLRASAVPVSAASLPLPAGAATAALQTQPGVDIGDVTVNNGAGAAAVNVQDGGNSITVDGPLTDAQLRATAVPISMAGGGYGGQVEGRAADGVAPVGNPVLIGGSDGSLTQTLLTDNLGRLVIAPAGTAGSTKGFANGRAVLAALTVVAVRETVYTEPASGAQRSMSSASAADTAAGTGARTVRITFYKLSAGVVTGPFTETVTLNGTTTVNTVATDIAYIEKMEVITVGSGLVNAGIITLFGATAGGGGTVWTVALGANQTFSAHHYVPSAKTCFITGLLMGIKGADTTSGFLRARDQTVANTAEIQISDQIRAPSSGQSFRSYATPIQVAGPARITGFAAPDSTSSRTYYLSFDFYEE